jgi:hypothetical protein
MVLANILVTLIYRVWKSFSSGKAGKTASCLLMAGFVLLPSLGMAREEPAPDRELLEFLGGFETAGGKPVDPLGFIDFAAKDTNKKQPEVAHRNKKRGRKSEKQEPKDRDNEN